MKLEDITIGLEVTHASGMTGTVIDIVEDSDGEKTAVIVDYGHIKLPCKPQHLT